tara:strand:+ start:1279 stop:1461 length:183 start_codon:yes stop_codon:yes gene_type:complete
MNKLIIIGGIFLLFLIVIVTLNDSNKLTIEKHWQNPAIFNVNREEPQAHFFQKQTLTRLN